MNISQAAAESGLPPTNPRLRKARPNRPGRAQQAATAATDRPTLSGCALSAMRGSGLSAADRAALSLQHNPQRTSREVKTLTARHIAELEAKIERLQGHGGRAATLARCLRGRRLPGLCDFGRLEER